jgi:hypothetical protein
MNPNVLFVFKNPNVDNPSACHVGMGVTASNAAMSLKEARIQATAQPIPNGEYLWKKLAGDWKAYTHVILCAPYIDAPFLTRLIDAYPAVHFALVYHSNLGFLSVDRFAAVSLPEFLAVDRQHKNFSVAANCRELADAVTGASGECMTYLPNMYHLPSTVRRQRPRWSAGMPLHIGLFGAARVLKNWLTAGVAAMIVQQRTQSPVYLHVNKGRDEGAGATRDSLNSLLGLNPGLELVEVPWLSADDFGRYLYGMDLMLQPSFTETFNNVTADGMARGVPSVVSEAIDWAPDSWIAKADSATAIADAAVRLLRDKNAAKEGWKALDRYNTEALKAWKVWLNREIA